MCNTDSIKNGSGNANCKSELDIAVQVTGLEHILKTQYQSLKLQHFEGKKEASELLKSESNEEINKKADVPSTIFKWDKKAETKAGQTTTLYLEVEAETGENIKLPLTENFTPRGSLPTVDKFYLTNRVYAIQPIVDILTPSNIGIRPYQNAMFFAPARIGYFYVFVDGKLWRELLISRDDEGNNLYQDINVAQYRLLNKDSLDYLHYQEGDREPVGKKLRDIWVPGAFYNKQGSTASHVVRMFYSDIQLSAARLTYLEDNSKTLSDRAAIFNWDTKQATKKYTPPYKTEPLEGRAISLVNNMRKIRGRDEAIEFLLDDPMRFLLLENYISDSLEKTKKVDDRLQQKDSTYYNTASYETGAWQYLLLTNKKELTKEEKELLSSHKELWDTAPAYHDVSAQPKARGIFGVLVSDINYLTSHHKYRLQDVIQTCVQLIDRAKAHEYSTLATFVEKQRSLIPAFDEGIKDDIRSDGKLKYFKATAQKERELLHQRITKWQQNIAAALRQPYATETIADNLSAYSSQSTKDELADLVGKYIHFVEALFLAVQSKDQYDPLATAKLEYSEDYYNSSPEKFVFDIFTNPEHRLHRILWPKVEPEAIEEEYQPAKRYPITNMGDGLFNQALWEDIVKKDVLKGGKATTLTGTAFIGVTAYANLSPLQNNNGQDFFKATTNALFGLIEKFDIIVKKARTAALQSKKSWQSAHKDFLKAKQEYFQKLHTYEQTAYKEENARKHLENYQNKLDQAEKRLTNIELEFQNQLEKAKVIKTDIVTTSHFQMTRMASGGKLYKLKLVTVGHGASIPKNYSILGDVTGTALSKKPGVTKVKRNRLTIFNKKGVFMDPDMKGPRKTVYLAVLPSEDDYLKLRQKAVTEEIPQLEAHRAEYEVKINQLKGDIKNLAQAKKVAEAAEQSSASTVHNAFDNQDRMGIIYRLQRNQAIATRRINQVTSKIQRSGIAPPILLLLELRNLSEFISNADKLATERGGGRALLGYGVAAGDTVMAALVVIEELQTNFYKAHNIKIPASSFAGRMNANSKLLALFGIKGAVKLVPLGALAALNIFVSGWDTVDAIKRGDSALWGHLALTAAGFAGLLGLYAKATSPILGLGALGWFLWGVGMTFVGLLLLAFGSDSEIEQWFKLGPFGSGDPKLADEQSAFAALLNLIIQPQIVVTNNPYQQQAKLMLAGKIDGQQALTEEEQTFVEKISKANTCISITSGFMNFMQNDVAFPYEIMLYKINKKTIIPFTDVQGDEAEYDNTYTSRPIESVIEQEVTDNGIMLFVNSPPSRISRKESINGSTIYPDAYYFDNEFYSWVIAAQVETTLTDFDNKDKSFYFPAPPFTEAKKYTGVKPSFPDKLKCTDPLKNPLTDIKADFWLIQSFPTGAITG